MHTVTITRDGELIIKLESPEVQHSTEAAALIIGIAGSEVRSLRDEGAMSVNGLEVDYTVTA